MKNLVNILVAVLLTSCGDSENKEAISREERVMKKEYDMKTCGPQWNFGFDFGRIAKIASDSERSCDWAFREYGYVLNGEKEKDCFCKGFLTAYDLK